MQSLRSRFYYFLTRRAVARLRRQKLPVALGRLERERQSQRLFRMPAGLSIEPCDMGGVAGEWLRPSAGSGAGMILYLHGGAYLFGSTITHRGIASALALESNIPVLNINYRLAPEHPFPAGLDDACQAYRALVRSHTGSAIALAGDSAGGGLALALAMRVRDQGLQPPAAIALFSPWTDLTVSNPTHRSKAHLDPYFPDSALLKAAAQAYAAQTPLNHPLLSPQFADLSDLPPTLIHVGEFEALLDDARVLAQRIRAHGSDAKLIQYQGMWHVWQTLVGHMPEADASMQAAGEFLRRQLTDPVVMANPMEPSRESE
jgi:monoterpene epsilon-lactone hydrolase